MGKATRWLKGIFGIKTTSNNNNNNVVSPKQNGSKNIYSGDWKRESLGKSGEFYNKPATLLMSPVAAWDQSKHAIDVAATTAAAADAAVADAQSLGKSGEFYNKPATLLMSPVAAWDQSKHAIDVVATTAAAADAAVADAQSAVAVVRLTSHGRGIVFSCGGGGVEKWAAVKIQTTFRGYLAKKALRALKGLVKIQALVRGYLVRKQATATLHGMQALIRAQATVRSKRALSRLPTHDSYGYPLNQINARHSLEILDGTRSEHAASVHSRRLSASFERRSVKPNTDDIPKIVEVDPGRSKTPPRPNKSSNSPGPRSDLYDREASYPLHLSIPSCQHWHDTDWGLSGEECRFSTTHSTPRFMSSNVSNPGPVTPSKSVCGDSSYSYNYNQSMQYGNYNQHPNYMANTQSFRSKVRSQSAPKQRLEKGQSGKRLSLNEMIESRNSFSGVKMQRSCSQVQGAISFKNAVMGKLERSYDFSREPQVYNFQRK